MFAVEQAGRIERTHAHDRRYENRQQVFVAAVFEGRHGATQHQEQPQQEAHSQQQLPEAAQIQVFVTLMAEPEVRAAGQFVQYDGGEVTHIRAGHHDEQGNIQQVYTQCLEFWVFAAVDDGGNEQTAGQEASGNPEQCRLQVPSTRQRVGQELRQFNAEEGLAFHSVVRHQAAQQNLHDEQDDGQSGIFPQGFL